MNKKQHGGKREGAGRKKRFDGPVTRIRVPQSCVPMVNQMLEQLIDDPGANTFKGILYPANEPTPLRRPIFSSSVPAGFPSPADDYIEGRLDLNEYFVPRPSSTFYVRVTGESMIGAGIHDGDIAVVRRNPDPPSGEIVIALIDDEVTLKRLVKKPESIVLKPENDRYEEIVLSSSEGRSVSILGTLEAIVRNY